MKLTGAQNAFQRGLSQSGKDANSIAGYTSRTITIVKERGHTPDRRVNLQSRENEFGRNGSQ